MINILFITGELNHTDGVSAHLFNLTNDLRNNKNFNLEIISSAGDSVERFRDSGINVQENFIFDHAQRSLKNFSAAIKELIKYIRIKKINIVHSHNHYAANIAYYASKFTGVKTIQTIHGLIPEGGFLKHFKAHKYITVNRSIETFLKKNQIISGKDIKFISQGFRYNGSIEKNTKGEVNIICASRLVYEKGVDLFIKAAKIVKSKYTGNVKFLIAGSGEYEDDLKKLAKKINADVTFLGIVNDLPKLLSRTNIFVIPTRSSSEGFPMVIVEAALTKNLIITSEFDFFENIFEDNADGLMFKVNNFEELAGKILTAVHNPKIAEQMVETFYIKSKKYFDLKTMIEKHIDLYKECLKT